MAITIRAHFDGRAIVPDEPVDLRAGQELQVTLGTTGAGAEEPYDQLTLEQRLERLDKICGIVDADPLPDEALSRESIYDERT